MKWTFQADGRTVGPFSMGELVMLVSDGSLPKDAVLTDEAGNQKRVDELPQLAMIDPVSPEESAKEGGRQIINWMIAAIIVVIVVFLVEFSKG